MFSVSNRFLLLWPRFLTVTRLTSLWQHSNIAPPVLPVVLPHRNVCTTPMSFICLTTTPFTVLHSHGSATLSPNSSKIQDEGVDTIIPWHFLLEVSFDPHLSSLLKQSKKRMQEIHTNVPWWDPEWILCTSADSPDTGLTRRCCREKPKPRYRRRIVQRTSDLRSGSSCVSFRWVHSQEPYRDGPSTFAHKWAFFFSKKPQF